MNDYRCPANNLWVQTVFPCCQRGDRIEQLLAAVLEEDPGPTITAYRWLQ